MFNKDKSDNNKSAWRDRLPARKKTPASARITNDNVSQHREAILSRGRKLKYPMQYSKIKLLIITIVVVVVAIGGFGLWLNRSLYAQQQTGDFYYSATKILPLNVADVDGVPVRYQDYLRRIRADIHYYLNREGRSFNSEEGKKELDYHKRENLQSAERAALVRHLASQQNITISDSEVDNRIKAMREADGSSEEFLINTLNSYYGWTLADYRAAISDQILEQKVAYAIDTNAKKKIDQVNTSLKKGEDFAKLAKAFSDDAATKDKGGEMTAKTSTSDPSGILEKVKSLKEGAVIGVEKAQINDTYYYYVAKLTKKDDDQINYSIIMVKVNELNNRFSKLQKENKIKEYISVPAASEFQHK